MAKINEGVYYRSASYRQHHWLHRLARTCRHHRSHHLHTALHSQTDKAVCKYILSCLHQLSRLPRYKGRFRPNLPPLTLDRTLPSYSSVGDNSDTVQWARLFDLANCVSLHNADHRARASRLCLALDLAGTLRVSRYNGGVRGERSSGRLSARSSVASMDHLSSLHLSVTMRTGQASERFRSLLATPRIIYMQRV